MSGFASMDILTSNGQGLQAHSTVGETLLKNGFNINALRTNRTLRDDEWELYDNKIVKIAQERLVAVGDLMNAGLRYDLPNALGTTRLEWDRISDMGKAELSMSGVKEGQNDRVLYDLASLPIPIIHKDFTINIRTLEASRRLGQPLDTTQAEYAARQVSELTEELLFRGANISGTNGRIWGYETFPDRNVGTLTAPWRTSTGEQIVTDILRMIEAAVADNMYGPYTLYIDNATYIHFGNDYKEDSDKTIMQRVMEIPDLVAVKASSKVSPGSSILIQMTSDVVDMVVGQQPTPIQWDSHGGFKMHFKVMSIMVPRIKSDLNGQSGVTHFT